jgi:type II secretion system protein H
MGHRGWPGYAGRGLSGFTLVEIMIVVAILGIVLAMGLPSFVQTLRKEPLRQAVSDVAEGLSQARAYAILQGVPAQFILRGSGESWVEPLPTAATARAEAPEDQDRFPTDGFIPANALFSRRLHEDVGITLLEVNFRSQMEAEQARVRFYPNGTCDDFTVVLEARGGIRKIALDPITGLADLETLR